MKPLLVIIFAFVLTSFSCLAQDTATHTDYKRFHEGKFEYIGLFKGVIVIRTKNRQIEYDPALNSKLIFKLKWVSDDTYWITFIKAINQGSGKLHKGSIIKTTITSATDSTYTCHWHVDDDGSGGNVSFKKIK